VLRAAFALLRLRVQSRPFGTASFAPAPSSDNTLLRDALRRNMPKLQEAFTQIDAKQAPLRVGWRMLAGACCMGSAPLRCSGRASMSIVECARVHTRHGFVAVHVYAHSV
jgi:hypothetical protein